MTEYVSRIVASGNLSKMSKGEGFIATSLRDQVGDLDPVLNVDHFHMSMPTFPPHPHAGFSAVTYMFEDSAGSIVNRDSLGDQSRIGPGCLHWTRAASGIIHEEVPEDLGVDCHGLQIFINLAARDKNLPPRIFHIEPEDIPVTVPAAGARIRVVTGELFGKAAPLDKSTTGVEIYDVSLSGTETDIPVDPEQNIFVIVIDGEGSFGADDDIVELGPDQGARFGMGGKVIRARASGGLFHFVVFSGQSLNEQVVFKGPFVMNTDEQIEQVVQRYRSGEMGSLSPYYQD